jgi:hypothetical protein
MIRRIKLRLRAIRFVYHRNLLLDKEHIEWAEGLLRRD